MFERLRRFFGLGAPRDVLIHAHQFKNAGTTLDDALQRSFGEAFYDHRDDDEMRRGAEYLGPWLKSNELLCAVSSHWITVPLPQQSDLRCHLMLMFRDPLERARSLYNFERRQEPAETPGSIKAKETSFLEYVRWQMLPEQGPALREFHTRYCSGNYLGDDLSGMYEIARSTVASTPLVGLVHRYAESMVLFEYHLHRFFPELDLSYRVLNSSGGHCGVLADRRASVERELAPVLDEYLAANHFDMLLFKEVEKRFDRNIAEVPDLEKRLEELRQRCESLTL